MSVGPFFLIVLLLAANAFFVVVEFGLMTSRRARLEAMADDGSRTAAIAVAATHDASLQLAGAQLGVTMASLGLGSVAEPAVGHLLESAFHAVQIPHQVADTIAFAMALAIVVFLHMVLGEM